MKNEVLSSLTVTISTIGTREIIVIVILLYRNNISFYHHCKNVEIMFNEKS